MRESVAENERPKAAGDGPFHRAESQWIVSIWEIRIVQKHKQRPTY